jgi:hypothetical protein
MIIAFENTIPDFCVAGSVLVTSSGVNFQNTLQDPTVSTPIQLLCTPYIRGSDAPISADEANEPSGGWGAAEADNAVVVDVGREPWNTIQGWCRRHMIRTHPTMMLCSDRRQGMRVQDERGHGDTLYLSGEYTLRIRLTR